MTNSHSKKIPCSECITLASCRAKVLQYDMEDVIGVMKAIATIGGKCTLVKHFIFETKHTTWGDGETMSFEVINDEGAHNVILEILGIP